MLEIVNDLKESLKIETLFYSCKEDVSPDLYKYELGSYVLLKTKSTDNKKPVSRYFFFYTEKEGRYYIKDFLKKYGYLSMFNNARAGNRALKIIKQIHNNMDLADVNSSFYDVLAIYLHQREINYDVVNEFLRKYTNIPLTKSQKDRRFK